MARKTVWKVATIVALLVALLVTGTRVYYRPLLNSIAQILVVEDELIPAEAIVVLAGDKNGERMMAGIDLYRRGYGKRIVFWGGKLYWNIDYADIYFQMFKKEGINWNLAIVSREELDKYGTGGEAAVNINLLRRNNLNSFIIVTSDYHTARTHYIYRKMVFQGMQFKMYPVHEAEVPLKDWWTSRRSAVLVFTEFQKYLWYYLGEQLAF